MRRFAAALIALLAASTPVLADDHDVLSGWKFDSMLYAWIPGTFGTISVAGRTVQVDSTVSDVLNIVFDGDGLAAGGYFAARHDRWNVFLDAFGGSLKEGVRENVPTSLCTLNIAATATIKPVIVDAAVGYTLGRWALPQRTQPISLGAYAGMRFTHLGNHIRASAGVDDATKASADVSANFNWADPMIGDRLGRSAARDALAGFSLRHRRLRRQLEADLGNRRRLPLHAPWRPRATQPVGGGRLPGGCLRSRVQGNERRRPAVPRPHGRDRVDLLGGE